MSKKKLLLVCVYLVMIIDKFEKLISELAEFYGLYKHAIKMHMHEIGYTKIDGAFTCVNSKYIIHNPIFI